MMSDIMIHPKYLTYLLSIFNTSSNVNKYPKLASMDIDIVAMKLSIIIEYPPK